MNLEPHSVRAVAEKDFRDAVRSRALLLLSVVFVVFFTAAAFFFADSVQQALQGSGQSVDSDSFLQALTTVTRLVVPLIGLILAYAAIVGERESGTVKLLLSLPHSRLDVVVGKFLGRSAVVALPVLLGFLAAVPVFPATGVEFKPLGYAGFAILTVLVGMVFVGIALGASASSTTRRSIIGSVGLFALFTLLWGQISQAIAQRASENLGGINDTLGTDFGGPALSKFYLVVHHLNPLATYESLTAGIIYDDPVIARVSVVARNQFEQQAFAQQVGDLPGYLSTPVLVLYLLAWIVVPVALGYLVFERKDL